MPPKWKAAEKKSIREGKLLGVANGESKRLLRGGKLLPQGVPGMDHHLRGEVVGMDGHRVPEMRQHRPQVIPDAAPGDEQAVARSQAQAVHLAFPESGFILVEDGEKPVEEILVPLGREIPVVQGVGFLFPRAVLPDSEVGQAALQVRIPVTVLGPQVAFRLLGGGSGFRTDEIARHEGQQCSQEMGVPRGISVLALRPSRRSWYCGAWP